MKWGVLFFLLLVACATTLQAVPGPVDIKPVEPVSVDSCEGVICDDALECADGKCACPEGQKNCDNECIDTNSCCKDNECSNGQCIEGSCVENELCSYGEISKDGKCVCGENYKFCEDQGRCVSRDSCCSFVNCGSFETCVTTSFAVQFCMQYEKKKICKLVTDIGRSEFFDINDKSFSVEPVHFLENSIEFLLGNESLTLKPEVKIEKEGITMWQEDFRLMGGYCREDKDETYKN